MTDKVAHVQLAPEPPEKSWLELEPYTFGAFTFSAAGLSVVGTPPIEEWDAVGHMLAVQVRGLQFMVGDWLRIGETLYGERAAQVIDARHWSESTVRAYRWVAEKVPAENRMLDRLDYAHHQAVAALAPREQKAWLKRACGDGEGRWTVPRLKAAIRNGSEPTETGWYVVVECASAAKRDALRKKLELEGYQCRAGARREAK